MVIYFRVNQINPAVAFITDCRRCTCMLLAMRIVDRVATIIGVISGGDGGTGPPTFWSWGDGPLHFLMSKKQYLF
jgi:hypothetical protein